MDAHRQGVHGVPSLGRAAIPKRGRNYGGRGRSRRRGDRCVPQGRAAPRNLGRFEGASLRTFFIGNCKLQFSNVYRRWAKETETRPGDVDDGKIHAELEHQRAPRVSVEVAAELRRQAARLRTGSIEHINVLDAAGFTNREIAKINNTTEGAINARLHRAREKVIP